MTWNIDDPQGNEAAKCAWSIVRYTRGVVLDLGCGPTKAFPHFIGVDNCKDTDLFGVQMKPDVVIPDCADISDSIQDESVDAVFSSHLLEHLVDPHSALANWWKAIKVGGHLVLYLPDEDLYPRCGEHGANPDHKHNLSRDKVIQWMSTIGGWDLLVNEQRNEGYEYSFLQVYKKRNDGSMLYSYLEPRPSKTACVVRYGGFGDGIQASNILPSLKAQGYHVTFMTTPSCQDVILHDPNIDEWFLQDKDQVPNGALPAFWDSQKKHYDKWINLSESIEGTLLAMPGKANHGWPHEIRAKYLNRNYLEWTAELAGVPYTQDAKFYPTPEEVQKARTYLNNGQQFNIMWVLAGSSIHKFTPWQDQVIARIMLEMPEARLILSGDAGCKMLEQGWEAEPRIRCESGNMGIRDTLALAQQVDCVVGAETGVLNAVAFKNVGKVVMLSHSSKENLSRDWYNTETLEPENTSCYPCHQLHFSSQHCPVSEETGTAICQANISPERIYNAIFRHYLNWKLK